jgi:hypothetical protein
MRRRYLFTIDDVLVSIMFITSLSLFLSLEYKKPPGFIKRIVDAAASVTDLSQFPVPVEQYKFIRKKEQPSGPAINSDGSKKKGTGSKVDNKFEDYAFSEGEEDSSFDNDILSRPMNLPHSSETFGNKQLQELLFSELREMSEEDTRKLF